MSELILHFGMHKTGSSAIQRALRTHDLGPDHACVGIIDSANQSAAVIAMFSRNAHRHHNTVKRGYSPDEIQAIGQQQRARFESLLREHPARSLVLSAEDAGQLKEDDLRQLRRFVQACGRTVRAVAYVRTPVSYMESALQQRIKGGLGQWRPQDWWPTYRERFQKFDRVFGREAVSLWKYDPATFPDGDVVCDFFTRLGMPWQPAQQATRVNESLSLPAVRLLYAYRQCGPGYGVGGKAIRANVMLIRKLGELPGPRLRLARALCRPMLQRHAQDLLWVEQRLGCPMADLSNEGNGLRSEADLLSFGQHELEWLHREAGVRPAPSGSPAQAGEVAAWVHRLRLRLLAQAATTTPDEETPGQGEEPDRAGAVPAPSSVILATDEPDPAAGAAGPSRSTDSPDNMNLRQLITKAKGDDAELNALPEEAARKLVARVMREIRQRVNRLDERELVIGGLGTFTAHHESAGGTPGAEGAVRVEFKALQRGAAGGDDDGGAKPKTRAAGPAAKRPRRVA
jgi:hypothetical protein